MNQAKGRLEALGPLEQFGRISLSDLADVAIDRAQVTNGFNDIAGASLTLGTNQACAFADTTQRFAQVGGAADKRHREGPLVDVMRLIGGCEDF